MDIIIKLDEKIYTNLKNNEHIIRSITKNDEGSDGLKAQLSILNGTVLPNNPTNGDVIKAMFPNVNVFKNGEDVGIEIDGFTMFSLSWWDAPYEEKYK